MGLKLTTEKLEEYMDMLKRGEINTDELSVGLRTIHGMVRLEEAMTPMEFIDYLGVPLDQIEMSDGLRRELKAAQRQKKWKNLLGRLFRRDENV